MQRQHAAKPHNTTQIHASAEQQHRLLLSSCYWLSFLSLVLIAVVYFSFFVLCSLFRCPLLRQNEPHTNDVHPTLYTSSQAIDEPHKFLNLAAPNDVHPTSSLISQRPTMSTSHSLAAICHHKPLMGRLRHQPLRVERQGGMQVLSCADLPSLLYGCNFPTNANYRITATSSRVDQDGRVLQPFRSYAP